MNILQGSLARLWVLDNAGKYVLLGGSTDMTLEIPQDITEAVLRAETLGATAVEHVVPQNIEKLELTAPGYVLANSPGDQWLRQQTIGTAVDTSSFLLLIPGVAYVSGAAVVTTYSISMPVDGLVQYNMTARFSGGAVWVADNYFDSHVGGFTGAEPHLATIHNAIIALSAATQ